MHPARQKKRWKDKKSREILTDHGPQDSLDGTSVRSGHDANLVVSRHVQEGAHEADALAELLAGTSRAVGSANHSLLEDIDRPARTLGARSRGEVGAIGSSNRLGVAGICL